MKNLLLITLILFGFSATAQISKKYIGSSYNMYNSISPSTNPVHTNNALGTISFTHRQNASFPGGSSVIQTTWSEDGGLTWGNYVLQPTIDETQFNRYPSGLILDPTGNNSLSNAQTIVAGPTSSTSSWLGNYFYNFALDGSGGREFNLLNTDAEFSSFTRNSMMADNNNIVRILGYEDNVLILTTGEYDAIGQNIFDQDSIINPGIPGYYWTQQILSSNGLVEVHDYSMAFNQNGNIGYVVHQGSDATGQIVPFVHYSSDGGATWTQIDHDFSTIEDYISPYYNGGIDCAVDINGHLHMISSIYEGDASIEEENRKIYDIVVNSDEWSADLISVINTERVLDSDPMAIHGIGYNHRIQAARSYDGSKVFAVWTDVNLEEFGEDIEKIVFPDIYAFGKDVQTGMVTGVTNFTKWTQVEGSCFWMFTSPVTYDTNESYTLPSTISEAGNSELDAMEHFYIDGISFGEEDFNIIPVYGCTDINYFEYDSIATIDDGSCQVDRTPACQYEEFVEYIPNWPFYDNSACITLSVLGCVDDGSTFTDNINNYTFEIGSDGIDDDWKYDLDGDGLQAFNYNPLATYNDSSCYPVIVGCFDSNYYNFNDFDYDGQPNPITGDEFSDINTNNAELCVPYYYGCTDLFACNFNYYANTDNGSCVYGAENVFLNNVQHEYNLSSNELFTYFQQGTTTLNSSSLFIQGTNLFTQGTDLLFYASANTLEFIESSLSSLFSYFDNNYEFYDCFSCINDLDSDGICDSLEVNGCTIPNADNYNNLATEDDGNCIYFGCTNGAADNYDSNANIDNGSCIIYGCTFGWADNYLQIANVDNGSCVRYGCMNFTALNYDPLATHDSNDCIIDGCDIEIFPNFNPLATDDFSSSCDFNSPDVWGCTDPEDCSGNYNPNANLDNGSCEYPVPGYDCFSNELTHQLEGQWIVSLLEYEANIDLSPITDMIDDITIQIALALAGNQIILDGNALDAGEFILNYPDLSYQNVLSFSTEEEAVLGVLTVPSTTLDFESQGTWVLQDNNEVLVFTDFTSGLEQEYDVISLTENTAYINGVVYMPINLFDFPSESSAILDLLGSDYLVPVSLDLYLENHMNEYTMGCMDPSSCNFNSNANTDNGSCVYGAENVFLNNVQNEYNLSSNELFTYFQQGTTTLNSSSLFIQGTNLFTQGTDLLFYASANTLEFIESSLSSLFSYFDNNYEFYDCFSCINDLDSDGICDELEVNGCTIPNADNYNNLATEDDGNCIYFGCTNGAADNYDSNANIDNGSCIIYGCVNSHATNYNSNATTDDESCLFTSLIYDNIVLQTSNVQDSLINLQQTIEYFNTTIYLDSGWNLFGYGCPEPHEVTEILSSFTDIVIITKDNNGNVYMPQFNFNGIGSLSPGYGYQIKLSESIEQFKVCDWYFNEFIGK